MNAEDPRIVAALAELRAEYALELPSLVAALAAAVTRLRADPDAALDALAQAHRLRGTAGSYGFHALSEAIAGLEHALALQHPPAWRDVDAALAEVVAALPPG